MPGELIVVSGFYSATGHAPAESKFGLIQPLLFCFQEGSQFMTTEAYPPKLAKARIRKKGDKRHHSRISGVCYSEFTACESPLTYEEYRAGSTSKRRTLEVMHQAGDKLETRSVQRNTYRYSSLERFLDYIKFLTIFWIQTGGGVGR